MGHQRLAPPASKNLPEIINLLVGGRASKTELVNAVAKACDLSLKRALKDPAFVEALWLFIRIPQAAKTGNFPEALRIMGVTVPDAPSIIDIVIGFESAIESVQRKATADITDLSEMAKLSGISALHSLAHERLPSLWQPTREDMRTTIATFTAPEKFGDLSQRFFTNFVEHTIHYFLDRELPRHIGPDNLVHSVGDLAAFDGAVRRHCAEATIIMRAFAKDWLGNNVYNKGKDISRHDVVGFAAHASEKIRKELAIRSTAGEVV
jgi:hypothetical protein